MVLCFVLGELHETINKLVMNVPLRILNLEDNVADADLNQAMVSARWPHSEFVRVETREDFIAALEQTSFDLIFSDFTMPCFDGREALSIARKKCPETPFLFVSGTIGEDMAIETLKNGATDYVLKHRLIRLLPAVDRALREAGERAERDRAELAMRESEHKYREVFESLDAAAFLTDESTGKIIDTNRGAESMLGCGRGEILGKKQSHFLTVPEEAKASGTRQFYSVLNCANGGTLPVRVRISKLAIHGHSLQLWLCAST